ASSTPFFFKQWGGRSPKTGGRLLQGDLWDQYPRDKAPLVIGRGTPS
ncbi:MAG: phage Gp37/Gp68 family protein, partial [Actinomycetota bacterium]|nr:phage Gp37/Gp68 family protein [Actinomycetota bacterium]